MASDFLKTPVIKQAEALLRQRSFLGITQLLNCVNDSKNMNHVDYNKIKNLANGIRSLEFEPFEKFNDVLDTIGIIRLAVCSIHSQLYGDDYNQLCYHNSIAYALLKEWVAPISKRLNNSNGQIDGQTCLQLREMVLWLKENQSILIFIQTNEKHARLCPDRFGTRRQGVSTISQAVMALLIEVSTAPVNVEQLERCMKIACDPFSFRTSMLIGDNPALSRNAAALILSEDTNQIADIVRTSWTSLPPEFVRLGCLFPRAIIDLMPPEIIGSDIRNDPSDKRIAAFEKALHDLEHVSDDQAGSEKALLALREAIRAPFTSKHLIWDAPHINKGGGCLQVVFQSQNAAKKAAPVLRTAFANANLGVSVSQPLQDLGGNEVHSLQVTSSLGRALTPEEIEHTRTTILVALPTAPLNLTKK